MKSFEFRLLGPLEVRGEGGPVQLGGPKQRALLALLLVDAGRAVSTDRLIDALWGEQPPRTAATSLQNFVSQLRKQLGPDLLVTKPPGYLLRVDPYIQHNAWIGYRFDRAERSWLQGTSLRLGMNNVFETNPPQSSDQYGFRTSTANPRGRQFTMEVSKRF